MDLSSSNKSNIPITNPDHICGQDFFLYKAVKFLVNRSLLMYNYNVEIKKLLNI